MVTVTHNSDDSGGCVVVGCSLLKDRLFDVAKCALLCLGLVFQVFGFVCNKNLFFILSMSY